MCLASAYVFCLTSSSKSMFICFIFIISSCSSYRRLSSCLLSSAVYSICCRWDSFISVMIAWYSLRALTAGVGSSVDSAILGLLF